MQLLLEKSTDELTTTFKVPCDPSFKWTPSSPHHSGVTYPVITNERPVQINFFEWGFHLYLDESQTLLKKIITAGAETIFEKPAFEVVRKDRCLVPLEGWFFSKQTPSGKTHYKATVEGQPLLYGAGIWEKLIDKNGNDLYTFLLLTQPVQHSEFNRMPCLLQNGAHRTWLSTNAIDETYFKQLTPFPGNLIRIEKQETNP